MIVVCARESPRSAIISTRSRKLSLERRYQRTQRTIISRSKWRPLKSSSMLSTRQLYRSNNQPASYAALTQFAPEPLVLSRPCFLIHGGSEFWTSRGAIDDGRETYGACQNLTRPVAAPSGSSHIHQCWRPSRVRICAPVLLATSKTSCGGTYGSSVAWINSAGRRDAVASSFAR